MKQTEANGPLISVKDLKKYFSVPNGLLHAVDGVSFDIRKGETLGVVGESGCGKTTLGRTMLRLIEPTSGQLLFNGKDLLSMQGKQMVEMRKKMQIIFQDPYSSLNPRMSIQQTLVEPLYIHKIVDKRDTAACIKKVRELMDMVGLASRFINAYPHELDGGRRQRIGIARALALDPEFIVCDEPVSALDVSIQAQILNLMQDLQRDMDLTYVFITHDLSVVRHISTDIAVMYLGMMVEKCPSKQVFINPLHPYTKALLSAIPIPDIDVKMKRLPMKGELTSPINPGNGCRFAKRCPYATERCFTATPALKEVEAGHLVACHLCANE